MRTFLTGIFTVFCGYTATKAQDVYLSIPENNIFNRTEFTSVPTRVMTNANRTNWDYTFFGFAPIAPTFTSVSGPTFTHSSSSFTLPGSTLLWQLESMGGQLPSTGFSGSLPGFQSFSTSAVKWFEPPTISLGEDSTGEILILHLKFLPHNLLQMPFGPGITPWISRRIIMTSPP